MPAEVRLDLDRQRRTGLGEAVMCAGKSPAQLQGILNELRQREADMLFTRLDAAVAAGLDAGQGRLDYDALSRTAIFQIREQADSPTREQVMPEADTARRIAVVTAGTSDLPVAREACRTLAFHGEAAEEIHDIGVAGLWRLQEQLPRLRDRQVIICVAGMDAALPTVLGGLVPGLIVAVPSSVGYGIARGGETALHALLCSCAQGLVVVNIDNGFGAACAALRALH